MTRPHQVMDLWSDYEPAAVIGAAFECDLFRPLLARGALDASAVAGRAGLPLRLAQELLDALVQLGALRARRQQYRLSAAWAAWLRDGYDDVRSRALSRLAPMRRWLALGHAPGAGPTAGQEEAMFRTGQGLERYLHGVREFNRPMVKAVGEQLLPWLATLPAPRVADLGGGHAAFTLALAAGHAGLSGDVIDLPATIAVSERMNHDHPLRRRVRFIACDARKWTDDGSRYDLVMVNDLLHSFGAQDKRQVLAHARAHLAPTGRLLVTKFTRQRGSHRRDNALFSLKLFVNTDGSGYLEDDEDVADIAAALGLSADGHFVLENKSALVYRAASPAPGTAPAN